MWHCKVDLNAITVVNVTMHLIEAIAILAAVPDQYSTFIVQAIAILAAVPDQYSALIAHLYER